MNSSKIVLVSGFAMFSMFFGSGNLVFPLLTGVQSLNHYPYAIIGLIITAVFVPFLGLLGMIQYRGNKTAYFSPLGKPIAFTINALMLSIMGPFGIIPRCIMVSFGGVSGMCPSLPFWTFSLGACLLIAALIWRRNKIVSIIGIGITPFKLGSIILLIIFGLYYGRPLPVDSSNGVDFFWVGIFQGYQTMDLIGSFFFACTIYEYLKNRSKSLEIDNEANRDRQLFRWGVQASLVGALILSSVYVGFTMLGAKYAPYLQHTAPEMMLVEIARQTFGAYAIPVVGFTLAISCLATATIVATLFVDFIKNDISRNYLNRPQAIVLTLGSSFIMSLLGFQTICQFLGMILQWIYPLLLGFSIIQIIRKFYFTNKKAS